MLSVCGENEICLDVIRAKLQTYKTNPSGGFVDKTLKVRILVILRTQNVGKLRLAFTLFIVC